MSVKTDATHFDTCPATGKRKFRSQARAYVFLGGLQKRNRRKGDKHPLHVYRCPCCSYFHTGHVIQAAKPRRVESRPDPTERAMNYASTNWHLIECKRLAMG